MDDANDRVPAEERRLSGRSLDLPLTARLSDLEERAFSRLPRCWQCGTPAGIQLPIGTVRAQLCPGCAERARQLLTVSLYGADPLFRSDEEDGSEDERWEDP